MTKNVEMMSQYDKAVYKTLVNTGTLLDGLITVLAKKGIVMFDEILGQARDEIECINSIAFEADQAVLGNASQSAH